MEVDVYNENPNQTLQGGASTGSELGAARVAALEQWLDLPQPDVTWLFDVPLDVARLRMQQRSSDAPDRFEREDAAFFTRTRAAYHARAAEAPARIRTIDATRPIDAIRAALAAQVQALVADWRSRP